jgi:uncharacterized membrane protein YfcA
VSENLLQALLLLAVGLAAGTINSIAGGGSLLTLPAMIFLGLPPTIANGTNRVAILLSNIGAAETFRRRGLIPTSWFSLAVPPTLVGALIGTWGATRIGDFAFQRVLAVVLVVLAVWMVFRPVRAPEFGEAAPPTGEKGWLYRLMFLGVGLYGGFIQAGLGFFTLAITSAGGLDLVRGNALKVTLVFFLSILALGLFAWADMVDWVMGLMLAVGTSVGAVLGVHLQVLKGQKWVRGVVTVTILVFAARLLLNG